MERKKIAFFDMDGTLCATRFQDKNGNYVAGFIQEEWLQYCIRHGKNSYSDCMQVRDVWDYARRLKDDGYMLFVLSTIGNDSEKEAKTYWLDRHERLWDDYIYTDSDSQKVPVIVWTAMRLGATPQDCILVEDTFSIMLAAADAGICAMHTANVITGLLPGKR